MSVVNCPCCGNEYDYIGVHWAKSSCDAILTDYQKKLITGVLMGDGWIDRDGEEPCVTVAMTNEVFLQWLSDELGYMACDVRPFRTAAECAELSDGNTEDYNDQYSLRTRSHSVMREFADWYGEDGKRFPKDLELTPDILKMWYVCDGGLTHSKTGSTSYPSISCSNEMDREEYILSLFDTIDITATWRKHKIFINPPDREKFFHYMGDAPPGFGYKWDWKGNN